MSDLRPISTEETEDRRAVAYVLPSKPRRDLEGRHRRVVGFAAADVSREEFADYLRELADALYGVRKRRPNSSLTSNTDSWEPFPAHETPAAGPHRAPGAAENLSEPGSREVVTSRAEGRTSPSRSEPIGELRQPDLDGSLGRAD